MNLLMLFNLAQPLSDHWTSSASNSWIAVNVNTRKTADWLQFLPGEESAEGADTSSIIKAVVFRETWPSTHSCHPAKAIILTLIDFSVWLLFLSETIL